MSWLRRLSRDRSYKGESSPQMPPRPASFQTDTNHNSNNINNNNNHNNNNINNQSLLYKDTQYSSTHNSRDKLLSYRASAPQDQQFNSPQRPPGTASDATMHTAPSNMTSAPDPLTKAFNEAIKPYIDQIETLKNELEDTTLQLQQLEDERADMHAWIDKRGLRADVPPSIAQAMNTDPSAAQTLNYHLDRKMTVLNHDLHRLQDSLSTHLPTSTFATTLETLIPSIENLSSLPNGPPLAFELIIKLGGNLNSHGGDEGWNNEADVTSRAAFYGRLDECMVDVIRQRLSQSHGEDPPWMIIRDIKRLEKTGSFLKSKIGLQAYFPRSLEVMQYEVKRGESQLARPQRVSP